MPAHTPTHTMLGDCLIAAVQRAVQTIIGSPPPDTEKAKAVRQFLVSQIFGRGDFFAIHQDAGRVAQGQVRSAVPAKEADLLASCNLGDLEAALLAVRYQLDVFIVDAHLTQDGVPYRACAWLNTHCNSPDVSTALKQVMDGQHYPVVLVYANRHYSLATPGSCMCF